MASSLRRRRVLAHLVVRRLALALVLQLELAQQFPIRVRTVVQACSMLPCFAQQVSAVGYQGRFRYGIRQAPKCAPPSLRLPFACILGTSTLPPASAHPLKQEMLIEEETIIKKTVEVEVVISNVLLDRIY